MSNYNAVLSRNPVSGLALGPCSQTVAFSHYNHLSAQLPIDPATGKLVDGDAAAQASQCLTNIAAILDGIGQSLDNVIRVTIFLTDGSDADAIDAVYRGFFTDYLPTRTVVGVAALPLGASVQIEALVSYGLGTIPNAPQANDLVKVAHNTATAPLSDSSTQTVAFSHYNNITAQLPINPATGELVAGGVQDQARQCLRNVKSILEAIDVPFDDIVKVNIFLTDLADAGAVDEVYSTFFPDSGIARTLGYVPARTVVPASWLPRGASVQVEAVVSHGDGTPPQAVEDRHGLVIRPNNTDAAPRSALSTQTVAFSHYNNLSAQLPMDAAGSLVEGGAEAQAAQCLTYLEAVVESIGHSLADMVKVNIYLTDRADLDAVNRAYAEFFPGGVPARRVVGVSELPGGASVMIDGVLSNAEGTPPVR